MEAGFGHYLVSARSRAMEVDMIANIKWLAKRPDLNNADRFLFVWLYLGRSRTSQ
jgi:hypothetical protein